MAKKMLIDATHSEETRVVVVDGQKVEDFDFESITKRQLAGNIYLAKVTRVEPSLQAAFVEYGGNRHGFLAFSEIHPDYYQIPVADREALLAEEAREEEERRAREESGEDEKPARSGRGRGRSRKKNTKKSEAAAATASVAGLEVVEIDDANAASPTGLEIADPSLDGEDGPLLSVDPIGDPSPAEEAEPQDATADQPVEAEAEAVAIEQAEEAAPESADTVDVEDQSQEAAPEDTLAEAEAEPSEDADEQADDETEGPKSIAEAAGLEDEERVTEELGDPDSARTVTAEDATDQTVEATEQAEAEAPEDAPAEAKDTADAAEAGGSDSDASGDSPTEDNAAETQSKPRRKRRSRSSKKSEEAADTAENNADQEGDQEASDVESVGAEDTLEEAAQARTRLRRRYKIQDVVKVRQIMLVQVVKEERGNKGAALTTYLSLAGRYCVLMPNTARGGGISRKITNASDRKRLREITGALDVPQGMGLIVRTAGAERTKAEIKRDYEFLIRQWEQIRERTLESIAPTQIYEEGSLIKRSIRDVYSKEIDQILVEGEAGYREAKEYMKMLMPSHAKNVQPYTDPTPLFSRYQVETYLNGMFNPTVQLKSGGYIVIGVTEALVAIDVNSGRATKQGSIEETALQTNLEAADEVARQLRLRDLAGLIVIDFIDMDENRNNRAVEKRMKDRLKNDRARIQVGRISAFGLMEMSRQRLRPGMLEATTQPCAHCMGTGLIRSDENLSLSILREIEEEGLRGRSDEVTVRAPIDVANYLINNKRTSISQMEERHSISINVLADPTLLSPNFEVERSKTAPKRGPRESAQVVEPIEVDNDPDRSDDANAEGKSRRRRGKRGGKRRRGGESTEAGAEAQTENATPESSEDEDAPKSKRGRSRRRGGRGRKGDQSENAEASAEQTSDAPEVADEAPSEPEAAVTAEEAASEPVTEPEPVVEPVPEPEVVAAEAPAPEPEPVPTEPAKPKKRGWWSFGG